MRREETQIRLWWRLASQVHSMVLLKLKARACFRVNLRASVCSSKFLFYVCIFFFLLLFCLPCCKLVCVPKCAQATQLLCQPPCEVNIAALGKQIKEDLARAVKKGGKKRADNLHTERSLYPIINTVPRNTV